VTVSRRWFARGLAGFGVGLSAPLLLLDRCQGGNAPVAVDLVSYTTPEPPVTDLLLPTYLGNDRRCFYGRGTPKQFKLVDQFYLGTGKTKFQGITEWSGAGWTGQPTLVRDRGKDYLIIGSYDHHLRKIDLATNGEVWRYKFDDILKGTATIYEDETADADNRIVILQGSREGLDNDLGQAQPIPSLRAISFRTGRELWRLDIRLTDSYSRDHDGSPLYLGDGLVFTAGENGIGYFLASSTAKAKQKDGIKQPPISAEVVLYQPDDIYRHRGNLVTESSPARLHDRVYIASGSGHIFGIDIATKKIVWDFFTGTDLDGTVVISRDEKLFVTVEKQYNSGQGGVLKLNPAKPPKDAVEWFLPTGNLQFEGWEGGIIGSTAINDEYNQEFPALFAVVALDGFVYIGSQHQLSGTRVLDPHQQKYYDSPLILYQKEIGSSISTPIFTDDHHLIVPSYNGVHWFKLDFQATNQKGTRTIVSKVGNLFNLRVSYKAVFMEGVSFESTPIIWDNLVRICSRDGYLYTIG
jgi:outer membrane protein assembly factor BamB